MIKYFLVSFLVSATIVFSPFVLTQAQVTTQRSVYINADTAENIVRYNSEGGVEEIIPAGADIIVIAEHKDSQGAIVFYTVVYQGVTMQLNPSQVAFRQSELVCEEGEIIFCTGTYCTCTTYGEA